MRYFVLIIGLVGSVGAGILGYVWMEECQELKDEFGPGAFHREPPIHEVFYPRIAEFDRRAQAWPFLLAGAGVGLVGVILAFDRRRFSGAALLFAGALGVVSFNPLQKYVMIFGLALVLAGLLALFSGPPPPKPAFAR